MTPAHRRRRGKYSEPGSSVEREASSSGMSIQDTQLNRPAVLPWLRRELQALLLQEDVEVIAHHIIGTLKSLLIPASSRNVRSSTGRRTVDCESAKVAAAEAALPYLPDNSQRLAQEFVNFVISGLNVAGHDAAAFHLEEPEQSATGGSSGTVPALTEETFDD